MHQKPENTDVSRPWRGGFQARKWRNWAGRRLLVGIFLAALLVAMGGFELIKLIISWVFPGYEAF